MALARQGVEVRMMNTRGLGVINPRDVLGQVDENTRLVALASCHFISGYRIDIDAIGKGLHERNIMFCLDAIQTVGAFPTSLRHVDLMAADAHKWMLGPCGAGIMVVRKGVRDQLNPPLYGWHNVRCPNYVAQEQIQFRSGAHKFEAGTHNLLGIVGLVTALELLLEVGVENIAADLLAKRASLVPALRQKGYTVLNADAQPQNASAIVSFFKPEQDMAALHQRLTDRQIVTSLRTDRKNQRYIRLSPHFYNTQAELDRALELL
jgi:selenocysteine lyase/cysteine desulfurase